MRKRLTCMECFFIHFLTSAVLTYGVPSQQGFKLQLQAYASHGSSQSHFIAIVPIEADTPVVLELYFIL